MPDLGWIIIPHWDGPKGFQHYRDRSPTWIKEYPEQLSEDEYRGLTFHQRGVLHGIRLEYARARRQLRGSTVALTRQLGDRVTTQTLKALEQAGRIEFSASKPLAEPEHSASATRARTEKRREEDQLRRTNPRTTDRSSNDKPPLPPTELPPQEPLQKQPDPSSDTARPEGEETKTDEDPNINLDRYWHERQRAIDQTPDLQPIAATAQAELARLEETAP